MTFDIIWDSIGSDIDVAIHNQRTNENMWIIASGKPQLMAIQKVVKLLNELHDENEKFNEELMEYDSFKRLYEEKTERLEKENEELRKNIQEKEEVIEFYQRFCGKGDVK